LRTTGVKCKVEHTTTPPAAFHAVRNAVEGHRADVAKGALVNVLAAAILQANPSIEDAMEDADMVRRNLKEMSLGNWGNSHNS
jgi:hypothetical protein